MANTITAVEFAQIMRDAIAQIQPAAAAAPVVNVEAAAAPTVDVDVEGIIAQLRAMRGKMVTPANLRGIVNQVKELQTASKQNTRQIVAAIETLANTTPEQTDIQPIVDELLEITAGVELLGEDVREVAQQIKSVGDIMNPYREMSREQIVAEMRRIGITNFTAKDGETQAQLSRKLNMIKAIQEQADAIYAYQQANPSYIDAGYERRAFDIFVKTMQTTPKGIPTHQTYQYIPQSVPQAVVKLNPKTGNYDLSQGGHTDHAKKWSDAERWALKGGHFGDELSELRKIRAATERRDIVQHAVFKARKL